MGPSAKRDLGFGIAQMRSLVDAVASMNQLIQSCELRRLNIANPPCIGPQTVKVGLPIHL